MVSLGPQRVRVEIGELVLDGIPPARHARVAAAFERELGRLLLSVPPERGSAALAPAPATVALRGSPERIGRALARSVHAALTPTRSAGSVRGGPELPDHGDHGGGGR